MNKIIELKEYKFMNENLIANNIENNDFNFNNEEDDYSELISKLLEIGSIISLLNKNYLD